MPTRHRVWSTPRLNRCLDFLMRVGRQLHSAKCAWATLRHARSEQPGLPDVLGSRRACRWHLSTWQAPRFGRRFPCLRRVPQPNRIGMPRSLTPILSAWQKPKGEQPPIRSLDTTEHRRPDAAFRGGHTHRRGSQWHRAMRLSAQGFRASACLWDGRT
jgi:hypothetical protein